MKLFAPRFVACTAGLLAGCGRAGEQVHAVADAGDTPASSPCGSTPTRIVDYVPQIPEAGQSAVQVPTIEVSGNDLLYLLNWFTPIGSVEGSGGLLMRVPILGGEPTRLATVSGGSSPGGQGLAVAQGTAVFSQARGNDTGAGAIVTVPVGGGDPVDIAATTGLAKALVADETNVYFVDDEGTKSVPLAGGPVRTLTSERPFSLGLVGSTLYLGDFEPNGALSSVPINGGPVAIVATDPGGVLYPQSCGDNLCWLRGPALDAGLTRLAPDGKLETLARGFIQPHDLVFDGSYFFLSTGHILLHRIPVAGGEALPIESQGLLTSLSVDMTCLYWSSAEGIFRWALSAARSAPNNGF